MPGCFHEFEIFENFQITRADPLVELGLGDCVDAMKKNNPRCREQYEKVIGKLYVLRCKKCGKIKRHEERFRFIK